MNDCKERILPSCGREIAKASTSGSCPEWSVCLPFGGRLYTNGGCIHYDEPNNVPEDGEYSRIVIVNGCITEAHKAEIPLYTQSPCAPVPNPCDCGGGGGSALPDPSSQAGNLFRYDASGRPLVKLSIQSGKGISVTGAGTASDPLIIMNTQEESDTDHWRTGSSAIILTGTGTASDPHEISHAENMGGSFMGLTFDKFGHLTGYQQQAATGVNGIVGMGGVRVDMDMSTRVATVQLTDPVTQAAGNYSFGGFDVQLDPKNRIATVNREIDIRGGTYAFGNYDVELNDYGSVTGITDTFNNGAEYVKYFESDSEEATVRYGTFILRTNGYVRIVYETVVPASHKNNISLSLDSSALPIMYESYATSIEGGKCIATVECRSQGVMAAGEHVVAISLRGGQFFDNAKAKLVVTPTWPFEQ